MMPIVVMLAWRNLWRHAARTLLTASGVALGLAFLSSKDYTLLASADRVKRGEVNSVGRYYLGGSLAWQVHPLLSITGTALINLGDGSALLLPHADWSLTDNLSLVFGGAFGIGPGPRSDRTPRSEYGSAPQVFYAAIKAYF